MGKANVGDRGKAMMVGQGIAGEDKIPERDLHCQ